MKLPFWNFPIQLLLSSQHPFKSPNNHLHYQRENCCGNSAPYHKPYFKPLPICCEISNTPESCKYAFPKFTTTAETLFCLSCMNLVLCRPGAVFVHCKFWDSSFLYWINLVVPFQKMMPAKWVKVHTGSSLSLHLSKKTVVPTCLIRNVTRYFISVMTQYRQLDKVKIR